MSHLQDQLAAMAATSTESIVELFSSLDDRPTAIVATSFLEDYGMARPFGQPRYCCWRFEGREKSDEDCNSRN